MGVGRSRMDKAKELQRQKIESMLRTEFSDLEDEDEDEDKDLICSDDYSGVDPRDYSFPFENLVIEGGGSKCISCWGAIKALEEAGILKNMKRFGGTSMGALIATHLALGYKTNMFQPKEMKLVIIDGTWFDFLPNIFWKFGVHTMEAFYKMVGEDLIANKTGNPDSTFLEVYKKFGKELCIVVTNLSTGTTEYCHPKTTPDMPIRQALRMSMSLPGMFTVPRALVAGETNVYTDGGLTCNYPIHCFDGWYLSMERKDSFFSRLHGNKKDMSNEWDNRFDEDGPNVKTLGLTVCEDGREDIYSKHIEKRLQTKIPRKPTTETKLYKEWKVIKSEGAKARKAHEILNGAATSFMQVLQKCDFDKNGYIERSELENALKDESLSKDHAELLFGDSREIFEDMDREKDGKIEYRELVSFLDDRGISLHNRLFGHRRVEISNLCQFIQSLEQTVWKTFMKNEFKRENVERTVGINSGYIGTVDFDVERADLAFLNARGYHTCQDFLRKYVVEKSLVKRDICSY